MDNLVRPLLEKIGTSCTASDNDMRVLWLHAQKKRGWVYIAENKLHEGLLKVGYTQKDPFSRARSLKTAGVVGTFKILSAFQMVDCISAEAEVHNTLRNNRVDGEFFRIQLNDAIEAVTKVWRDERQLLKRFEIDWLLHDQDDSRWKLKGFKQQ